MTKSLGRYKETTPRIGAVRAAHGVLGDAQKDIEHSYGKEERHRARIAEFTGRLDAIAAETARLQADRRLLPRLTLNGSGAPASPGSVTISCGTMPR